MWHTKPGHRPPSLSALLPSIVEGDDSMPTHEGWMTTSEAAEALHLSLGSVQNAIKNGTLRAVKLSRVWFITPEALDEYRREHAGRQGWDKRRQPGYEPDPVRKSRRLRQQAREAAPATKTTADGDAGTTKKGTDA